MCSGAHVLECPLYFLKQASLTSQLDLLFPPRLPSAGLQGDCMPTWLLCGFSGSDSGPQLAQQAISQPNSSVLIIMEG